MRRSAFAAFVLAAAIGCKKKREEPVRELPVPLVPVEVTIPKVQAPTPAPAPAPPPVFPLAKLAKLPSDVVVEAALDELRRVIHEVAPELGILRIEAKYVRKDGALDPSYGSLRIETALSDAPDGIVDDPDRPTGAPIPEVEPAEQARDICPILELARGEWSLEVRSCRKTKLLGTVRCSIAELWKMAIAQGAPADAVALIDRDADEGYWGFSITDKVRKVNFKLYLDDTCASPATKKHQ